MKKRKLLAALGIALVLAAGGLVARKIIKRHGLALPVALVSASGPRKLVPLAVSDVIYDQKLMPGWDDWGWGPHQLGTGPAKIKFQGYGGLLLHHTDMAWRYGGLAFRFKVPATWSDFLLVSLRYAGKPDDAYPVVRVEPRHIALAEDGWREVLVDWQELNPDRLPFDRLLIASRAQVGGEWAELDHIVLTKPAAQDTQQGTLRVMCDGKGQPISELIYGASADFWSSGQTAKRIGGNPLSRANWELGSWNTGSDWFFENVGQPGTIFDAVEGSARDKRWLALVVPMLGWVAKDNTSFSFPKAKSGDQRKFDPYKPEAGDGFSKDGTPIRPGDPSQTSIPAPPELIGTWVRKVLVRDTARGARGVQMYILDNEPTLWNVTHRDVHPDPLSYDELLDRTVKYATAIREADPQAIIAGPAEWGFTGYEFSAVDREAGALRPDRRAHGDMPLVAWYLKKLREHEKATGVRLLDVFDLHFYPQAEGMYGGNVKTDPAASDLRVRSTRALWDPDYVDESWIKDKVRLIPRMKEWVAQNYPGLKLSLGEWNFGAEKHTSGGLAVAESLGRFGQQGLYSAFFWGDLVDGTPAYWAFRAFRNFDGRGARFQDISVPTREAANVSLFASRNSEMTRLVLVLVNRNQSIKVANRIELQGCGRAHASRLFSYVPDSKGLAEGTAETKENVVSVNIEPSSISVLDVSFETNAPP